MNSPADWPKNSLKRVDSEKYIYRLVNSKFQGKCNWKCLKKSQNSNSVYTVKWNYYDHFLFIASLVPSYSLPSLVVVYILWRKSCFMSWLRRYYRTKLMDDSSGDNSGWWITLSLTLQSLSKPAQHEWQKSVQDLKPQTMIEINQTNQTNIKILLQVTEHREVIFTEQPHIGRGWICLSIARCSRVFLKDINKMYYYYIAICRQCYTVDPWTPGLL